LTSRSSRIKSERKGGVAIMAAIKRTSTWPKSKQHINRKGRGPFRLQGNEKRRPSIKIYSYQRSGKFIVATGSVTAHTGTKATATIILHNLNIDARTKKKASKILREGKYLQKEGNKK
jgi:hypothetical protein